MYNIPLNLIRLNHRDKYKIIIGCHSSNKETYTWRDLAAPYIVSEENILITVLHLFFYRILVIPDVPFKFILIITCSSWYVKARYSIFRETIIIHSICYNIAFKIRLS